MNQITQKQQGDHFVNLIMAQRQLYEDEKYWMAAWLVVTAVVATISTITLLFLNVGTGYLALVTVVIAFLEYLGLQMVAKRREQAAAVQELYDTELLDMPWNDTLTDRPKPEIISEAAMRCKNTLSDAQLHGLVNWYTTAVDGLPLYQARLVCQKENIWWNEKLRRDFANLLYLAVALLFILILLLAIFLDWTVIQTLGPIVMFLPVFMLGLNQAKEHRESANRLERLQSQVENVWQLTQSANPDIQDIEHQTRNIQNEIYHIRSGPIAIPSWFHKWHWKKMETLASTLSNLLRIRRP